MAECGTGRALLGGYRWNNRGHRNRAQNRPASTAKIGRVSVLLGSRRLGTNADGRHGARTVQLPGGRIVYPAPSARWRAGAAASSRWGASVCCDTASDAPDAPAAPAARGNSHRRRHRKLAALSSAQARSNAAPSTARRPMSWDEVRNWDRPPESPPPPAPGRQSGGAVHAQRDPEHQWLVASTQHQHTEVSFHELEGDWVAVYVDSDANCVRCGYHPAAPPPRERQLFDRWLPPGFDSDAPCYERYYARHDPIDERCTGVYDRPHTALTWPAR